MTRARTNAAGRTYIGNGSYDIGALEQRVYGIEKSQTALVERINEMAHGFEGRFDRLAASLEARTADLSSAIEKRSSPQWQAVSVGVTLIGMVGLIVYSLIQTQIARHGEDIDLLQAQIVPRAEIDDRREISGQRTERIEADIQRLIASTYPREVHLERWAAFSAELDHHREEMKAIREDVTAISPTGSVLDSLADRIGRLESRWIDRRMDQNDGPPIP